MSPLTDPPSTASPGQIAVAVALAALAVFWLLPRAKGRQLALGTFAGLAAAVVAGSWAFGQFGAPYQDDIGSALFWLFAAGAVGFGTAFVVQTNPARGAICFAFVVLSVCGLFLLLAAPFLAAATVVVYAGAVIVTFLFVLMLSQTGGPADENDRTREPLLGSLGGFGLLGLVLFTLHVTADPASDLPLPAPILTTAERLALLEAANELRAAEAALTADDMRAVLGLTRENARSRKMTTPDKIMLAVGPNPTDHTVQTRLVGRTDRAALVAVAQAKKVREVNQKAYAGLDNAPKDVLPLQRGFANLRAEVLYLAGTGDLPARNVANVGYALYADHLLAVELAGTLLLVATIGAVVIAGRKGAPV